MILGFIRILKRNFFFYDSINLANDFLTKLREYFHSRGKNLDAYSWLIYNSNKMQNEMGSFGIYAKYKPPYQNNYLNNYPIILNLIPELRRILEDEYLKDTSISIQYAQAIEEALIRYLGKLGELLKENEKALKNPVIWLREGFQLIISFPILLALWLGLISRKVYNKIIENFIFKGITAIFVVLGFLGTLITIVLGWNEFKTIMLSFIKKYL